MRLVSLYPSIAAVETSGALPADTLFFSDGLNFDSVAVRERESVRRRWLKAGLAQLAGAAIVFADPDTGLEIPSTRPLSGKGPKHVYYDDLARIWERGQSLIVYHHIGRTGSAEEQIAGRGAALRNELPGAEPIAVLFRRRSARAYFILPNPEHVGLLRARVETFLASCWGGGGIPPHFQRVAC